ncbi:MAG: phosphoglucosamine mutase [Alphaproteobacteria bacterium]|nr:MAG: phosphoglucosamine mutase [Alphaproteobacteria bacterium]
MLKKKKSQDLTPNQRLNVEKTKRQFFGTDGIRGRANQGKLTPAALVKIAQAAALVCRQKGSMQPTVVIGKDTRLSSYMVESALASGFLSAGMRVTYLGPVPTPAVSMFIRSLRADLGVMISASHNPPEDNGLKFFNSDGFKLCDAKELEIETLYQQSLDDHLVDAPALAKAKRLQDAQGRYVEYAKNTFPRGQRLEGFKIVLDCANGATYKIAPQVLWELGAEIIPIGVDPDGMNINVNCGATATETLQARVLEEQADIGIALDGDGDRVIIVDEMGQTINGDAILGRIATYWQEMGKLAKPTVVATVMSNLGLERYLQKAGIQLERTNVGDRYVLETMRKKGYNLGGEQSGHIVLSDYATTGDGIISALQFLAIMCRKKQPASVVGHPFTAIPQILTNIRVRDAAALLSSAPFQDALKLEEKNLGDQGRILVRKSGTEPLIRIMVEGDNRDMISDIGQRLAHVIENQESKP